MPVQYQVVGHCAHASVQFPDGRQGRQLFFRGQLLPAEATEAEITHLLSINAIAPVAGQAASEPPLVETPDASVSTSETGDGGGEGDGSTKTPPDAGTGTGEPGGGEQPPPGPAADPEVEAKRAEARAKLPADGSKPDGRMGQPVWVEWLVGKGYNHAELARQDKKDLVELANGIDR